MITASNTYSETMLDLTCPTCRKKNEVGLLKFLDANNRHNAIVCVDCKNDFYVEVKCLTRAAEHRNEAEESIPAAICASCVYFKTECRGIQNGCGDWEPLS